MSEDTAARARLETMRIQHRLIQQQNMKLEADVKAQLEQEKKIARRVAANKRREDENNKQRGLEWKKQRYQNRMRDRARAKQYEYRNPRYRPAHSNYQPSSKTGVPKTGGNDRVRYSNFPREPRFGWQKVKNTIPGPSDYNPNLNNPMEQWGYVDYVHPYVDNEQKEAQREQRLKPGILKLQDKDQNKISYRQRMLGTKSNSQHRVEHASFGQDQQLRDAIRGGAGLTSRSSKSLESSRLKSDTLLLSDATPNEQMGSREMLSYLQEEDEASRTQMMKRSNDSDDIRALRRQLERVTANLQQAESSRKMIIRQFQQNIDDLKRRSVMQDVEIRTVGRQLQGHQDALSDLRTNSAELVGTLIDMSPIFTKDRKLQQPFNMIRSKALRVHQAIEDTSERLDPNHQLPLPGGELDSDYDEQDEQEDQGTPEKSCHNFVEQTRLQNMKDHTIKVSTLDKYRANLASSPPPMPGGASVSRRLSPSKGGQDYYDDADEDHLPPPPPPPPSASQSGVALIPSTLHIRKLTMSSMTGKEKVDYLFMVAQHHREKSGQLTKYGGEPVVGLTQFLRILRDSGTMSNKFHFDEAVHIFRKHAMGGSNPSAAMSGRKGAEKEQELVMSKNGFHNGLRSVSHAMYPEMKDEAGGGRYKTLLDTHLAPLARYLNDNEEHGRMTYEEAKNLDHFLHLNVVEYLIKHQSALQRVFTGAAGFNQNPAIEGATWMQARKNNWTMTLDQLLEYLKFIHITPEHVRKPDLDRALRCATAGNHLLHGTSENEINYAQFLEILGSLAINCFGPGTSESHRHLTTPLLRLQFLCMRVDGINAPKGLEPSNKHSKKTFKAAEKMMLQEEQASADDQKAKDRKRRVTLSLIGM